MRLEDLAIWVLVGMISGWLAGMVIKGGGYGIVGDMLIGIIGAIIGGFLFGLMGLGIYGFLTSAVVAFLGAVLLVAALRSLPGGTPA